MMSETFYAVDGRGKVARMERKDLFAGSDELRSLLERNPGLIAGDPAASEESGWLLMRAGLEIEDPEFGDQPWTADLVFADRDHTPIFVQCVPSLEERTRREIIGEVMEHVASVQSCFAGATTAEDWGVDEADLDKRIGALKNASGEKADSMIRRISERLAEGHLRLAYVTGRCPQEFKRVVDFLNRQMEHLEVAVVEVQEFRSNGFRLLIPTLFTSAAQAVEVPEPIFSPPDPPAPEPEAIDDLFDSEPLEVSLESDGLGDSDTEFDLGVETFGPDSGWDEVSFFERIEAELARSQVQAVRTFHQSLQKLNLDVEWTGDDEQGSLDVALGSLAPEPILSLHTDGELVFRFDVLTGDDDREDLQQRMRSIIDDRLGVVFHLDDPSPVMTPADWCPKVTGLLRVLDDLGKVADENK